MITIIEKTETEKKQDLMDDIHKRNKIYRVGIKKLKEVYDTYEKQMGELKNG